MEQNKYHEIVTDCIGRWGTPDEKIERFCDKFNDWISQISEDNHETVVELLKKFNYYPHNVTNKLLEKLHKRLITEYTISDSNTIYTMFKAKDGKGNSSIDYWVEYKNINNINKHICYDNITKITKEQWECIENIVFIDDCSGTGKTFRKNLGPYIEIFRGKSIFFVAIHMMKDAIQKIEQFAEEQQFRIFIINEISQDKAFSEWIFSEKFSEVKEDFIKASILLDIPPTEILGFEETESLMAFYNNTPNNTLGLFRYDIIKYYSIFPRRNDKKPPWQEMKRQKDIRNKQNYNRAFRSDVNG